jgi:hypothetical protein
MPEYKKPKFCDPLKNVYEFVVECNVKSSARAKYIKKETKEKQLDREVLSIVRKSGGASDDEPPGYNIDTSLEHKLSTTIVKYDNHYRVKSIRMQFKLEKNLVILRYQINRKLANHIHPEDVFDIMKKTFRYRLQLVGTPLITSITMIVPKMKKVFHMCSETNKQAFSKIDNILQSYTSGDEKEFLYNANVASRVGEISEFPSPNQDEMDVDKLLLKNNK